MTTTIPREKTPAEKAAAQARLYQWHESTEELQPEGGQVKPERRKPKNQGERKQVENA